MWVYSAVAAADGSVMGCSEGAISKASCVSGCATMGPYTTFTLTEVWQSNTLLVSDILRISRQSGHLFHGNPATCFRESGHPAWRLTL